MEEAGLLAGGKELMPQEQEHRVGWCLMDEN